MARQILYLHWKAVWLGMIPMMIAAFGLPLLVVQGLGRPEGVTDGFYAAAVLNRLQGAAAIGLFPALAAVIGATLALTTWSWDHRLNHVYALSLPIERWRYAVLKFGAGVLLVALPAAAMLVGGVLASASLDLPSMLHAYPFAVSTRFFLSSLLVFAILFAFAAGSIRTTVIFLSVFVLVLISGNTVVHTAGEWLGRPDLIRFDFVGWTAELLTGRGGPFHVLVGNWALIDV